MRKYRFLKNLGKIYLYKIIKQLQFSIIFDIKNQLLINNFITNFIQKIIYKK